LFIKRPLSDKRLLRDWCAKIDYEQNLTLVMLVKGKIVGEATLHHNGTAVGNGTSAC
jgi:hypothetical protein